MPYVPSTSFVRVHELRTKCGRFHGHAHAPWFFYMVRIAQRHHDVLIFVLGCAGRSNFVGRDPFSHVLSQFLIERQYHDGCFLHEHSSLVRMVIFKLTRDCTGFFAVVLGLQAVLFSLH